MSTDPKMQLAKEKMAIASENAKEAAVLMAESAQERAASLKEKAVEVVEKVKVTTAEAYDKASVIAAQARDKTVEAYDKATVIAAQARDKASVIAAQAQETAVDLQHKAVDLQHKAAETANVVREKVADTTAAVKVKAHEATRPTEEEKAAVERANMKAEAAKFESSTTEASKLSSGLVGISSSVGPTDSLSKDYSKSGTSMDVNVGSRDLSGIGHQQSTDYKPSSGLSSDFKPASDLGTSSFGSGLQSSSFQSGATASTERPVVTTGIIVSDVPLPTSDTGFDSAKGGHHLSSSANRVDRADK